MARDIHQIRAYWREIEDWDYKEMAERAIDDIDFLLDYIEALLCANAILRGQLKVE
jgi:hypothetical protein